jgi:asparagine synthetase B (glutamine-hydrolysing)
MPGILGIMRLEPFVPGAQATLTRMAEPLRYVPDQTVQRFERDYFAGAVVDHGPCFRFLKPAAAERDGVLLLVDGEVFPEAGDVPHELQGDSPTVQRAEYCLHLYLQHGPQFVQRLNGAFGIAVYDTHDHTVHLYSDRFGNRLLFVSVKSDGAAFASSVRSLLRWRSDIGRKYDEQSLAEFVLFERVLGERTLFSDVQRLLPSTHATWTGGHWRIEQYFEIHKQRCPDHCHSWKDGTSELLWRLRRSLAKRTADQGKAGLLLSGGLDSRLVMLACPTPPITASFCASEGPLSMESRIAEAIARAYGAPHIWLPRKADYYASIADKAVAINEGLCSAFVGCHTLGVHDLMAQAGIQVVLTGLLFDVAFKSFYSDIPIESYPSGPQELMERKTAKILSESSVIRRAEHQDLMMLALNDEMKKLAASTKEQTISAITRWCHHEMRYVPGNTDEIVRPIGLMAGTFWQLSSAMGMISGLASQFVERSPFFDNEMLNLALSLPISWTLRGRIVRRAIKQVSPRIARIRDANTGLPAGLCPPWDRIVAAPRQGLRAVGRHLSKYSERVARWRQPLPSTRVFSSHGWLFSHDAALVQCPAYRSLVETAIEKLPAEFFDVAAIQRLFQDDLTSAAPRLSKLFLMAVAFSSFDRNWGPNAACRSLGKD